MLKKEERIVVLGKNYSTSLSVIRALGKENFDIDLIYITSTKGKSSIAAASKYVSQTHEFIGRDDQNIVQKLEELYCNKNNTYVFVPTDDYTASLIDRYQSRFTDNIRMPYLHGGKPGDITHYMDKMVQAQMAEKYQLSTAASWVINLKEEISIPVDIKYPCFCKPLLSAKGMKNEIGVCRDEKSLKDKLAVLQRRQRERSILVQEFIDIDREYAMSGVCIDQTVIIPAILRKKYVAEHDKGVTIVGEISDPKLLEPVTGQLIALMKSLHFTGLFDIDLFESNGKLYFSEINFRSSGIGYSVIRSGANLPYIMVNALLGREWEKIPAYVTYGQKFFYDKTGWEDYIFGHITKEKMDAYLGECDFSLINDIDDPLPGERFVEQMQKIAKDRSSILRRTLKKIFRR